MMKGFEQLADKLSNDETVHELIRVSLVSRDGSVEDPNPDTRFDLQAITFQFEHFRCHIVCRSKFDQVEILIDEDLPWPGAVVEEISKDPPWWDVIGDFFLAHAWKMTNNKGYDDAIQLRFLSSDRTDDKEHIIQLEVISSQFLISRVEWGLWQYDPFEFTEVD